ncbi:hypothetical protein AB0I06_26190 [Streptomyces sp. NPDC050674]
MLQDPYAVLRALLRAEAARNAPKSHSRADTPKPQQSPREQGGQDRG